MKSAPRFLRWFGMGALIIMVLTLAQAAWLLDHGKALKKKDITTNGIGDLQLATTKNVYKILDQWSKNSIPELQPFLLKIIKGEQGDGKLKKMADIAEHHIYWDSLFIIFYTLMLFIFLNKAFSFWRLSHLKIVFRIFVDGRHDYLSVLSGKKAIIAFTWAGTIGILDILENIAMLHALHNFNDTAILLPIYFAAPKFVLLILAIIFFLSTFLFYTTILLINSPGVAWEKFMRMLAIINDPY